MNGTPAFASWDGWDPSECLRLVCLIGSVLTWAGWVSSADAAQEKIRFLVIDSYHREYNWSRGTHEGLIAGLAKFGYLDQPNPIDHVAESDSLESSRAVVKTLWMDTKRKSSKSEMETASIEVTRLAEQFKPHLIFLGDDNAANYIGNQFLDTEIPIVFWGVNNTPVKYGLVDSVERPGHNATGVFQAGYYTEGLQLLKTLLPSVKTLAVLSDETETGRSHVKAIEFLARQGALPLELVESVSTNDFSVWTKKALELQEKVDAFYVAQYNSLKDEQGKHVSGDETMKWYLTHIRIPEATGFKEFVEQGLLCAADDSAFNQGFEAAAIAHDILANGANPATYPPLAPKRGALVVNRQRARMLGIILSPDLKIDAYLDEALVLQAAESPTP